MASPRIGLACPSPGERAAFIEWCTYGKFHPLPMLDADSIVREMMIGGFEALVIDADLAVSGETPGVLRSLGRNRPLIVISDAGSRSGGDLGRRDATVLTRPITRDTLLLSITLALAEGRPARRSPRRLVSRLQAFVDGAPAKVIDVSNEGIRLELPERYRSTLPPFFSVKVPTFNVTVTGKRVWLNNGLGAAERDAFWCGVRLERNHERATAAWQTLVENAPASTTFSSEAVHFL